MSNKHYLSDTEAPLSFPQKRHVSAPSRYVPVEAPQTPLYSPITQAPSPISPRGDAIMIDKPVGPASPDDVYETALLTPQETKRSTASPPAIFQSPILSQPGNLDGRLAEFAQKLQNVADFDAAMDEDSDDEMADADFDSPANIMARYLSRTELNPDVIVLKSTIAMLRKKRQQCLTDISTLSRMKATALDRPERFAARVIAASRGAQKTNVHQNKHHWRLEENGWDVPGPIEIPKTPEVEWAKYGVPPMYRNPELVAAQAQAMQMLQPAQTSSAVQDIINPNSTRMTTRATNSAARSAAASKPTTPGGFNIRTGLDMVSRQKKSSMMAYSNPFIHDFNTPARSSRLLSVGDETIAFLETFLDAKTVRRAEKAVPPVKSSKKGINYSRSDREIMNQFADDSMDLNTPTFFGTRSLGRRHASLPTHLVGNASCVGSPNFVKGEDTSPSTNRRLAPTTAIATPPSNHRPVHGSTFLTRRQIIEQAKRYNDTPFEDI
ncbi:hypothetical protein TWF217_010468 [Orbilia oligospora]|nr:hypothetical protein TWF217_010468 [Orbilia oligospora]KAF3270178.1 hypothetical protein TWF128_003995 [Orbilia oligospora]KAF3287854.1 hypothetical protein TWF132_008234 [Orbilia oligospora]